MKIFYKHVENKNYCIKGIKQTCLENGIDFKEFMSIGISIELLINSKDSRIQELVNEVISNG